MPSLARRLAPGETVLADARPHWWYLAGANATVVVVAAAGVTAFVRHLPRMVVLGLAVVLVVVLARLVLRYLQWRTTRVLITTERVVHRQGVLSRTVRDIPLAHISDVSIHQSLGQRLLGAGNLRVESAGRDSREVFPWVSDPRSLQNLLCEALDHARPTSGVADEIARLDGLRRRGVLSDEEYSAQRARVLGW